VATAHTNIHLKDTDRPKAFRLSETGSLCVWIDGPSGLSLIGSDHALSKLRDEIDQFLSLPRAEAA
jgi:hypothetical protein